MLNLTVRSQYSNWLHLGAFLLCFGFLYPLNTFGQTLGEIDILLQKSVIAKTKNDQLLVDANKKISSLVENTRRRRDCSTIRCWTQASNEDIEMVVESRRDIIRLIRLIPSAIPKQYPQNALYFIGQVLRALHIAIIMPDSSLDSVYQKDEDALKKVQKFYVDMLMDYSKERGLFSIRRSSNPENIVIERIAQGNHQYLQFELQADRSGIISRTVLKKLPPSTKPAPESIVLAMYGDGLHRIAKQHAFLKQIVDMGIVLVLYEKGDIEKTKWELSEILSYDEEFKVFPISLQSNNWKYNRVMLYYIDQYGQLKFNDRNKYFWSLQEVVAGMNVSVINKIVQAAKEAKEAKAAKQNKAEFQNSQLADESSTAAQMRRFFDSVNCKHQIVLAVFGNKLSQLVTNPVFDQIAVETGIKWLLVDRNNSSKIKSSLLLQQKKYTVVCSEFKFKGHENHAMANFFRYDDYQNKWIPASSNENFKQFSGFIPNIAQPNFVKSLKANALELCNKGTPYDFETSPAKIKLEDACTSY